jgi:hypothetical protein
MELIPRYGKGFLWRHDPLLQAVKSPRSAPA